MDAFEDLTERLLWREGCWTRKNFKVTITKADKVAIGLPSMPRPEVDVVAFSPERNVVAWVECKSYLDSTGVQISAFNGANPKFAKRFRVFTDSTFRHIVTERLVEQLLSLGLITEQPEVEYWLVAGRIAPGSRAAVQAHFDQAGWVLRDRDWIRAGLQAMAKEGYEDDVVSMAAKLLND